MRLTLDRNELVTLIWAIEDLAESYRYDGGLILVENELRLKEKLDGRLRLHDLGRRKARAISPPAPVADEEKA